MLDFKVFSIGKVLYIKEFLYLSHAIESKAYILILFIYYEITCLNYIFTHNGINLAQLLVCLTFFELSCKNITKLIKLGGLSALSGNDKRSSSLINKHGVDLVDNRIVEVSLYKLILIDNHVIPKIIETKLIVGSISYIAVISLSSFFRLHII